MIILASLLAANVAGPPERPTAPTATASITTTAATSTPTVVSSASPTPTPSPASLLSDRFGFVWAEEPRGLRVRQETGQSGFDVPAALGWEFSYCSCAVSPDGTRIVYWTSRTPGPVDLRLVDVARPAQHLTIYRAPEDRRISGGAWSNDGSGILFSLEGISPPGGPVGSPPNTSLLVIEATGGNARTLAQGGGVYVPLGWDRAADTAAAALSGEGGYMFGYVTARTTGDPAPKRTSIADPIYMLSVDVSPDKRYVLGVFFDRLGSGATTVRWWKLGDFSTIQLGPRFGALLAPKWRPGSSEMAWIENGVLQLLDVERGPRRSVGAYPATDYRLVGFRHDGSAALGGSGSGPAMYALLELASGRSEQIAPAGSIVTGAVRFPAP
jgi:hypothetical protein